MRKTTRHAQFFVGSGIEFFAILADFNQPFLQLDILSSWTIRISNQVVP